jgi:seryl-tRNA synthetase
LEKALKLSIIKSKVAESLRKIISDKDKEYKEVVASYSETVAENQKLKATAKKAEEVIEALKVRVAEADKKLEEATKALKDSKDEAVKAVDRATVEAYKTFVTKEHGLSPTHQKLLERASTVQEVDDTVGMISDSLMSDDLPLPHSGEGKRLVEQLGEELSRGDADAQEVRDIAHKVM